MPLLIALSSLGLVVATVVALLTVRSARLHGRLSADDDLSGPQKFHKLPVPRVGGVAIWLGFVVACTGWLAKRPQDFGFVATLIACSLPAFAGGLIEDLTKRVSPGKRMLALLGSALLAALQLGAVIERTDIPLLDPVASTV